MTRRGVRQQCFWTTAGFSRYAWLVVWCAAYLFLVRVCCPATSTSSVIWQSHNTVSTVQAQVKLAAAVNSHEILSERVLCRLLQQIDLGAASFSLSLPLPRIVRKQQAPRQGRDDGTNANMRVDHLVRLWMGGNGWIISNDTHIVDHFFYASITLVLVRAIGNQQKTLGMVQKRKPRAWLVDKAVDGRGSIASKPILIVYPYIPVFFHH